MTNKHSDNVRNPPRRDVRVRRSTSALAHALIGLIQEDGGRFADITVREILDRAAVSRTTFYSHFRSKQDVLHSSYEDVFGLFGSILANSLATDQRLFPVREFVEHVGESKLLMTALRRAGLAEAMRVDFVAYAANIIERRIYDLGLASSVRPRLAARMLAAALIESIDWWVDRHGIPASEIDAAFHRLARTVVS